MKNFEDFENKSYEKARKVDYNFNDYVKFAWNFAVILFKTTLMVIQEGFLNFLNLFRFQSPKDISGQLALVTGGANGLGRAIAFRLAEEKCNVVIIDLNLNEAQKTAMEIAEKFNVKTAAYKVDVSDYDAIQQLRKDIERTMGNVDILVNNAGILSAISLREGRPCDIQKVIDVNLTSHFWTVRTFLDKMIDQRRGHIVAISSISGIVTYPLGCVYCATKFGVRGFMSALYDELCAYEHDEFIKTTCVYPSVINTRKEISDVMEELDDFAPRLTPEYAANVVVKGILVDKKEVGIPAGAWLLQLVECLLPAQALKFVKTKLVAVNPIIQKQLSLRQKP